MDRYRITKSVAADGVPLKAGAVVSADEIEAGCLESLVRIGAAVPITEAEYAAARGG
ncbi:hypothetical protein J0H58_21645 [bacterium]|mgnify:CR=1 FL=1|nr:hypothetical protein [bacterium]